MKKILFSLIFLMNIAYSDDDFGDEAEPTASKKVILRESKTSKKLSLLTIHGFYKVDKFLFRPISIVYRKSTTNNFRLSVENALKNISNIGDTVNNLFIFSHQRFIASVSTVVFNTSVGLLGTLNASKKFNLESAETQIIDILRFYNVPEVYFIMIGPVPLTLTTTLSFGLENAKGKFYSVSGGFITDFVLGYINTRAIDMEKFDLLTRLKPDMVYETVKNQTYSNAKYFKLNRSPFPKKQLVLKAFFKEKNL